MRLLVRSLSALVFASTLSACGPTYFLTMRPSNGSGVWTNGVEAAQHKHDSVDVRLSFVRYEPGQLVFAVDLINNTGRALTAGPTDFYFQAVSTQPVASAVATTYLPGRVPAFDPEPQIQSLTGQVAAEEAAATRVSGGEVLTSLGHVVENLASLKKTETKEQVAARETRQKADDDYYTRQRLEAAAAADQYRAQLQELRNHALRRTTVEPGQRIRGNVYFSRVDQADIIRVSAPGLPAGKTLDFSQTRTPQP